MDSFVILGNPSAYGEYIPITTKSEMTYTKNENKAKIPMGENSFVKILDLNFNYFNKNFKEQFPNNYYGRHIDVLLTDFLIVFTASNIARYRPKLWNNVLEGKGEQEAKFKSRVEIAYIHFNVDLISFLNEVKSQLWKWKSGPTPFSAPEN